MYALPSLLKLLSKAEAVIQIYQVRVYIDGLGREHARVKSAEGGRFTRSGRIRIRRWRGD